MKKNNVLSNFFKLNQHKISTTQKDGLQHLEKMHFNKTPSQPICFLKVLGQDQGLEQKCFDFKHLESLLYKFCY